MAMTRSGMNVTRAIPRAAIGMSQTPAGRVFSPLQRVDPAARRESAVSERVIGGVCRLLLGAGAIRALAPTCSPPAKRGFPGPFSRLAAEHAALPPPPR